MSGYNRRRRRHRGTTQTDILIRAAVIALAVMLALGAGVAVWLAVQNRGERDPEQTAQGGIPTRAPEASQGAAESRPPAPTLAPTEAPTATPDPDPERLYAEGVQYFNGGAQDEEKAYSCLIKAAEKAHVPSMTYVGYLYYHGLGTAQDHVQAFNWYKKAAEAGDAFAMNELGYMYQTGRGVERDDAKALEWYGKAAGQGSAAGALNLGYLYSIGRGVDKDAAKAQEWNQKGQQMCSEQAEQGNAASAVILGNLYKNGIGVDKSTAKASEWYSKGKTDGAVLSPNVAGVNMRAVDWGLGSYGQGRKPVGMAPMEEMAKYDAYYCSASDDKVLYLTFDCGYENGYTEIIMDTLLKHNAPATFFVVGHYLNSAPEITKRMVADGFSVGNHSYHHPDMSSISDVASFEKEMVSVSSQFKELTGVDLWPYYRPPAGKYCEDNLQMAKDMGYSTFFWSTAYADWDPAKQPSHESAMKILEERTHAGAIVLLHAVSKTNAEILDELLTKWENEGYTFRGLEDFIQ